MDTSDLIKELRTMPGNMSFSPQIRAEAANKLEQLQKFIDDMLGDHYVDCMDWYANRCRELEDERDAAIEDLKKALWDDEICPYCKHNYHCGDIKCDEYIEGVGMTDAKGNYYDMKWSCRDFDWGTCSKLENTPCNGCNLVNHFEWRGVDGNN